MPHALAFVLEIATTALAVAGMGYFLAALVAARLFLLRRGAMLAAPSNFTPGVSLLKSLKGIDPGMMDAFRSHCRQAYAGQYELLFGVSSPGDPAAAAVEQLKLEFPHLAIRLIECPQRLGANGKVSTLVQLAAHAQYDFLLINDSDITVGPRYLERVMACFEPNPCAAGKVSAEAGAEAGLVTALYRGRAHGTLPSRLEALGIAVDFQPAVLVSKMIERGLHYGLGSTLAVRRQALEKAGGLQALVDHLADDYEMGARISRAGYRVELSAAVVETAVPSYTWRAFLDHQLRWARTVRDARPAGYAGMIVTHGLAWALLNLVASGLSPLSLWLLAMSFFLRLALAATITAEVLADRQALAHLWLLPLRDVIALALWAAGLFGNTILWRGNRFVLKRGKLTKVPQISAPATGNEACTPKSDSPADE